MLLMIFGVAIIVFAIRWIKKVEFLSETFERDALIAAACITVGTIIALVGFLVPLHGYYDPVVQEEHILEELIENTDIYVIQVRNEKLLFSQCMDSNDSKSNSSHNAYNIELVVSNKYEKPTLVKYKSKPIRTIFTFACGANNVEYKIYASKENIKKIK